MELWKIQLYQNELYHFGIKGQRWGVRRFQNADGSLKPAGEKRYDTGQTRKERRAARKAEKIARNSYDYRQGDRYKNATAKEKAALTNQDRSFTKMYGKKAANRFAYDRDVKGVEAARKTAKKEFAKGMAKGTAVIAAATVAGYAAGHYAMKGIQAYKSAKMQAAMASSVAGLMGQAQGLNVVKGGFTLGTKHVEAGKRIINRMMGMAA